MDSTSKLILGIILGLLAVGAVGTALPLEAPDEQASAGLAFEDKPEEGVVYVQLVSVTHGDSLYVTTPTLNQRKVLSESPNKNIGKTIALSYGDEYTTGETVTVIGVINGKENVVATYTPE